MKPLALQELKQITRGLEAQLPVNVPPVMPQPSSRPSHLASMLSQATAEDVARLKNALSFVSSDVPRGIGTIIGLDGAPVENYWFGVILAIRRDFGDAGKPVAQQWSVLSPRYNHAEFDKDWNAYDPLYPNPVTIGSVYMLAKAKGWRQGGTSSPAAPSPSKLRYQLLGRTAIMAILPIQWRVKGVFPTTGLGAIYGSSGSGKSFLGADMGACIAAGTRWFGHRTAACPVTYLILEGEAGVRNRTEAWEKHNRATLPNDFKVVVQPFQLGEVQDVEDLGAALPKGGVVIIDTLNRAAPGMDENSSQDMGRMLAGMKRLQEITVGLVLFVHHTGKDTSKGMRGHSSLHAALDGAIEVERSEGGRSWRLAKAKDGADGTSFAFKLHVISLGHDADGDEITSCAVGPDTAAIFKSKEPSGALQKAAIKAIRHALSTSPVTGKAQSGPQTRCITVDAAVTAVAGALVTTPPNKRTNEARRKITSLTDSGYLHAGTDTGEDWLWQKS